MNFPEYSHLFRCLSRTVGSLNWEARDRGGPIDKILFWCKCCKFSWLRLADTPHPPPVPIHQEQLLGARLTCHHHRASHQQSCQTPTGPGNLLWNYLQPFVSSLSSASDTMCVIRPLVSLTMEPYSRLLQQIPYILFIISLIAELNISRSGVRFICSLNFPLWVSGKHRRPRVGSLPQLSPDMNMNQWSMIIFPSPVFSWPGRQSTNKKKCKTQYEEYDSSESQCYYPQMLLLSLPNDLHIKSCRFPIVNLPPGTGRTCTVSPVSCGDQSSSRLTGSRTMKVNVCLFLRKFLRETENHNLNSLIWWWILLRGLSSPWDCFHFPASMFVLGLPRSDFDIL